MAVVLTILILVGLIILATIGLIEQRNKINQLDQSYNSRRATNSQLDRDDNSRHGNCSLLNQSYNEMREKYKQLDREHNKTLDVVRRLLKTLTECGCDIPCPTGWELDKDQTNNRTCYFFSTDEGDWHSANDYCTSKDATLAIVTSSHQQNFIVDHDFDTRWIGLTDLKEVGVFRWVNGDLLKTAYWARGEPNCLGVEHCVTKGSQYDTTKWNNVLCTTPHRWICEKPRV